MALSLTEAAKLSTDDLQRGVIETIIEDAPLLQLLPFMDVSGNAYAYVQENALPSVGFRAVNAGYTEAAGTFTEKSESLKILGGDVDVDRFIIRTRPGVVADQRAEQTRMKAKAVRRAFQDSFINGDGTADSFTGLKTRFATLTAQVLDSGVTDGMPIVGTTDTERHAFLDKLDELFTLIPGGPDILLTNRQLLAKFKSAARRLTIYDETKTEFGTQVSTYNGVPIVDIGEDEAGNQIIPQTETQGASSVAGSIYAVRFGRSPEEKGTTGLTNGGVQVYDLGEVDDKPAFRTRIEFYCALALHGDASAARLEGLLAS